MHAGPGGWAALRKKKQKEANKKKQKEKRQKEKKKNKQKEKKSDWAKLRGESGRALAGSGFSCARSRCVHTGARPHQR